MNDIDIKSLRRRVETSKHLRETWLKWLQSDDAKVTLIDTEELTALLDRIAEYERAAAPAEGRTGAEHAALASRREHMDRREYERTAAALQQ